MGLALYRKYRSEDFDDVIGQKHVTTVLANSLKSEKFSHAYLFSGPRGVGKTSVARIFARDINGLDKNDTAYYPDIIEIDAASNRRIDEIRELRDKIEISPHQLKYKVYIIDEVHMLTKEAFNALLKTLEEPPAHAIFILATTDAHKVPDTIKSRCINLNFSFISFDEIIKHLKTIAAKEKIDITDGALGQIAEHSEGSLRDALTILDQLSNVEKKIDDIDVQAMLGTVSQKSIENIIECIINHDVRGVFRVIQELIDRGSTVEMIIKQLSNYLRSIIAESKKSDLQKETVLDLMDSLVVVLSYENPQLGLEIALSKAALDNQPNAVKPELAEFEAAPAEEYIVNPSAKEKPAIVSEQFETPAVTPVLNDIANNSDQLWQNVLARLKDQNSRLYGIARMAEPLVIENSLVLRFKFPFHYKQMSLDKNKALMKETLDDLGYKLEAVESEMIDTDNKNPTKNTHHDDSQNQTITNISNIFGSAELLE